MEAGDVNMPESCGYTTICAALCIGLRHRFRPARTQHPCNAYVATAIGTSSLPRQPCFSAMPAGDRTPYREALGLCDRMQRKIALDPCHDQIGKPSDLRIGQFTPTRNMMPFLDATSATCGSGMLGGEHRVPTPWRLFAILHRVCGADPRAQQFAGMTVDGAPAFAPSIGTVLVG